MKKEAKVPVLDNHTGNITMTENTGRAEDLRSLTEWIKPSLHSFIYEINIYLESVRY